MERKITSFFYLFSFLLSLFFLLYHQTEAQTMANCNLSVTPPSSSVRPYQPQVIRKKKKSSSSGAKVLYHLPSISSLSLLSSPPSLSSFLPSPSLSYQYIQVAGQHVFSPSRKSKQVIKIESTRVNQSQQKSTEVNKSQQQSSRFTVSTKLKSTIVNKSQ